MCSETADHAKESILTRTIRTVNVTTNRTGLRRVARIDRDKRNAGKFGLVLQERSQLVERPAVQIVTLRATEPYPVADTLEVFNGNSTSGAFRSFDNLFADLVVHIGCEPAFLAGQLAQPTRGAARLFSLEPATLATTAAYARQESRRQ